MKREIVVTESSNGFNWARYSDHQNICHDPSGYGHSREQALKNLAIDEAYISKQRAIADRVGREGYEWKRSGRAKQPFYFT